MRKGNGTDKVLQMADKRFADILCRWKMKMLFLMLVLRLGLVVVSSFIISYEGGNYI